MACGSSAAPPPPLASSAAESGATIAADLRRWRDSLLQAPYATGTNTVVGGLEIASGIAEARGHVGLLPVTLDGRADTLYAVGYHVDHAPGHCDPPPSPPPGVVYCINMNALVAWTHKPPRWRMLMVEALTGKDRVFPYILDDVRIEWIQEGNTDSWMGLSGQLSHRIARTDGTCGAIAFTWRRQTGQCTAATLELRGHALLVPSDEAINDTASDTIPLRIAPIRVPSAIVRMDSVPDR